MSHDEVISVSCCYFSLDFVLSHVVVVVVIVVAISCCHIFQMFSCCCLKLFLFLLLSHVVRIAVSCFSHVDVSC